MLAKLKAIEMALGHCQNNPVARDKINIFTDFLFALQALQKRPPPDNVELINKILNLIQALKHHDIHFHWIPSHAGIYYNEIADRTAERAKQENPHTSSLAGAVPVTISLKLSKTNGLQVYIALLQTF